MRLKRTLLGWGVFFLLLGGVPLAVRQGLITEEALEGVWRLWPLLLILAGAGILLRRTPLEAVTGLVAAGLFGLIAGSVIATGSIPIGCGGQPATTPISHPGGRLAGDADVEIRMNCGDLTVRPAGGDGWTISGVADDPPRIDASDGRLEIESAAGAAIGPIGDREQWTVTLPTDPTLDLTLATNAGTADLDLAGARIGRLELHVNAGSATLDLGSVAALGELDVQFNAVAGPRIILPAMSLTGAVNGNAAGNIRLCAPDGAGLRFVVNDNITATNNFDARGLVRSGDAWETPGFDSAAIRIELETTVNAGSFTLESGGQCGE
jgi:hypothetical protein